MKSAPPSPPTSPLSPSDFYHGTQERENYFLKAAVFDIIECS